MPADKQGRKRSNLLLLAIAASAWICVAADAGDLPNLSDTILFKELAHNCHPVDLIGWSHPTKQVLKKYQVPLYALEFCNSDKYPIFHVKFKYDPMGPQYFFAPFYHAMFFANRRNSMAFVEGMPRNVVVMISNDDGKPKVSFEQYKP